MEKAEFENSFKADSDLTIEQYHKHFVTLPCTCGYHACKGWAAVANNQLAIKAHNLFYGVKS